MKYNFRPYQSRSIQFYELLIVENWTIKIYTITSNVRFRAIDVLNNAKKNLTQWLKTSQSLRLPTYGIAFLIVHEGKDGVWSLINWWIGGEMLQSSTYYTSFGNPAEFKLCPSEGGMACVWELAVMAHERKAWINHVLKRATVPDFIAYLNDRIAGDI